MKTNVARGVVALFFCGLLVGAGMPCHEVFAAAVVNAGNKTCPVSGDKVNPKLSYDYKGKSYHFCCPHCIGDFKKDPEKYLAKLAQKKNAG